MPLTFLGLRLLVKEFITNKFLPEDLLPVLAQQVKSQKTVSLGLTLKFTPLIPKAIMWMYDLQQ